MLDPIESFQIAATYIAEGNWPSALPYLEAAAIVMIGDPDFDALLTKARASVA